jgi:hypothetical protein
MVGTRGIDNAKRPWSYKRMGQLERFELRHGDICEGDGVHRERTEVGFYKPATWRKDYWLAFSVLLEPGPPTEAKWLMLGQWHAFKDPWDISLWPPISLFLTPKQERLVVMTSSNPSWRQSGPHAAVTRYIGPPLKRGVWHSVVYKVRFDPKGHGLLAMWVDGQNILDLVDIPIGYTDMVGPYYKYGLYRPLGDPSRQVAWYANMEASNDPLADRIAKPLPV